MINDPLRIGRGSLFRLMTLIWVGVVLLSCATARRIENLPHPAVLSDEAYSIRASGNRQASGELSFILAFSGGGTRAAALAYGVLMELRDTEISIFGRPRRLLDEVDTISSVSGGSFTSAYYGLHGDRIFDDFETLFLKQDIQGILIRRLFSPRYWFRSLVRTDVAVGLYEEAVFHGATFADLNRSGGPLVLINASDLSYGVRFTFVQEYFNLLCSDISSFPVARAVTASSAVPVLFNPVAVRNYHHCKSKKPEWMEAAARRAEHDQQLAQILWGMESYFKEDERQYAHFVDGGITDNLGLRAIYDIVELSGGAQAFLETFDRKPPRYLVIISVDASTERELGMDSSSEPPPMEEVLSAVSSAQIHRYNAATLSLIDESMKRWARELSTPDRAVSPYLIQVRIRDIEDPDQMAYLNRIPTSFSLSEDQVDRLIRAGRELLRKNPKYRSLLSNLGELD